MALLCDKCGKPVEKKNDAVYLDAYAYDTPVMLIFCKARHLLPTGDCEGSPSRAQYLQGQPRDARSEYPYDEDLESKYRAAYERMQE